MSAYPAYRLTVSESDSGLRLDKWLTGHFDPLSRSRIKTLIDEGCLVRVAGETRQTIAEPDRPVKPGETFELTIPPAPAPDIAAQAMPLDVPYEDEDIIVVNKPPGLVVHPAPGNPDRTLVNALMAHCGTDFAGVGGAARPGIVHRLDKDTSGLMVVAKTETAYQNLVAQFSEHRIERLYQATVWGVPAPPKGRVEAPIGRHPRNRKKMGVTPKGRPAITDYRTTTAFGDVAALVECRLETGRTHQIRVHLSHIGHPVIGDALYGRAGAARRRQLRDQGIDIEALMPRQALHAAVLGITHPVSGKPLHFRSELPRDMLNLVNALSAVPRPGQS